MRTTVDLPDPLFRRAKLEAVERGITLRTLIEQALEMVLDQHASPLDGPGQRGASFVIVPARPGLLVNPTREDLDDWI